MRATQEKKNESENANGTVHEIVASNSLCARPSLRWSLILISEKKLEKQRRAHQELLVQRRRTVLLLQEEKANEQRIHSLLIWDRSHLCTRSVPSEGSEK